MNQYIIAFGKWISHAFSEKDPLDGDMRFSIGRSSFVAWFWFTLLSAVKHPEIFGIVGLTSPIPYFWLLGFSLLGYVIGKEYLVLSFLQKNGNGHEEKRDDDPK